MTGPALLFGAQEKAVVFSSDFGNADGFHYLLCNEDVKDSQGAIMHSAQAPLKDLEIMQFLYELGSWRAVVLHSDPLHVNLIRVIFKNQEVNVHCASKISKRPSSWPAEQPVGGRHRPFHVPAESQVVQEVDHFIDFNIGDQEFAQLFASHQHVLCDDPSGLDLPEECKSALAGCDATLTFADFDRLVIYCDDGSSVNSHKYNPPLQAEEGGGDTWSFLALGERYSPPGLKCLGWTAQPTHYSPDSGFHLG